MSDADDSTACLACGACCFSTLSTYLRLDGEDHARLGDDVEELTHFVGNRCYLRLVDGHCKALVIEAAEARFRCGAYDHRPATCRLLLRGSLECEGERATKGHRPAEAVAVALALAARATLPVHDHTGIP